MSFRFPIESTHLLFFARAIGDPNADETDFGTAISPPTFGYAFNQFRPGYSLRPQAYTDWIGSGRGDSGADASGFEAGLHAEQHFEYHQPLVAGMTLLVDTVEGASWTKPRRDSGHLAFSELITSLHDEATGALVQTVREVGVAIRSGPPPADSGGGPSSEPASPGRPGTPGTPGTAAGGVDLPAIGDRHELVLFEGLTRTQIVMYAGAGGDYNPLHTDEIFTTRVAGYPSVFAHGMLTMGASARVLTEWIDARLLRAFRAQFRGQVWPGDTLTATAVVTSNEDGQAVVAIRTNAQDDRLVMTGSAVLAAPPAGLDG